MASKSQASHTEDVPYNGNDDDNNADMVVSERKAETDDSNDANSEEKADSDNSEDANGEETWTRVTGRKKKAHVPPC